MQHSEAIQATGQQMVESTEDEHNHEADLPDVTELLEDLPPPRPKKRVNPVTLPGWIGLKRLQVLAMLFSLPVSPAEHGLEPDALVLTVLPALEAQVKTDPGGARQALVTLLPSVQVGGPAALALADLALELEQQGQPRASCAGVTLVYRWGAAQGAGTLAGAEASAFALGKALDAVGVTLRSSPGDETVGIPWTRLASLSTATASPKGARALQRWLRAVGACVGLEVDGRGQVRVHVQEG